ncbi:MAG: SufD family Fe-S cluster assembly protein [Bacteroidales bacterium]|nr:SufD family Fe-S cluster assembly protein [Bacteroidales bacterium]
MSSEVYILRPGVVNLPPEHIEVHDGETLNITVIVMPGVSADIPIRVDVCGTGASVTLNGLYLTDGNDKVSIVTDIRHTVGGSTSSQLFNGVAAGESRFNFFGKILIAQDAQKIEAYQTNRNILLSEKALIDTKPQLEIYADDVKCSHGATVGQLNADEQFYMRSRGIPEVEAKVLQIISFLSPVLAGIEDEKLRASLSEEVEQAVRKMSE